MEPGAAQPPPDRTSPSRPLAPSQPLLPPPPPPPTPSTRTDLSEPRLCPSKRKPSAELLPTGASGTVLACGPSGGVDTTELLRSRSLVATPVRMSVPLCGDGARYGTLEARAAGVVLAQAAALPLSRRNELIAAAAALPELAALFTHRPGAAAAATAATTPSAATPGDSQAPTSGSAEPTPPPSLDANLDLWALERKLIKLAAAARDSTAPSPAPALAAAELPAAPDARAQQGSEPAAAAADVAGAADALTLSVVPEYEQYGLTAEEPVRAVVSIKAIAEVPHRAQVALTCVLDRSGSMRGTPIELVRQTVHFLIDQLTADDWLGLVSYAGDVREDLPLIRMTADGAALAHTTVEALCAGGKTALYDGLEAGVRQQMAAEVELRVGAPAAAAVGGPGEASSRLVHSCFLFTDGQGNHGPRTPGDVRAALHALQAPSGQHVTVHTFGFGEGHSVELLQAVAEAQSGVYYYISCTDDIASGFGDALGGLLAVVAKSVRVEVRPRGPGIALAAFRSGGRVIGGASASFTSNSTTASLQFGRLRGRPPAPAGAAAGVPTGATFNDMFAEETRECLVVLNIPPADPISDPDSEAELAVVDLSYTDAATGAHVHRSAVLRVRRSSAPRPMGQLPAELVFVTAARFETLDAIEAARNAGAAAPGDDVSVAHRVLDEQLGRLQSSRIQTPAVEALVEQTRVARSSITPRTKMDQTNVAAVAGAVQALRQQRTGTSTLAIQACYAQYDYKCKSTVRQTAAKKISGGRKSPN